MNHMKYIDAVAAQDVALLREKESTYQGSWKKAGGRSAWFMLRRNMDRLLTMMARPKDEIQFSLPDLDDALELAEDRDEDFTCDPAVVRYLRDCYLAEDIFAKIEENPTGEDGTVLACIRDLRCYLLLVEAEMVARDTVDISDTTIEPGAAALCSEIITSLRDNEFQFRASGLTREQCARLQTVVSEMAEQAEQSPKKDSTPEADAIWLPDPKLHPWMLTKNEYDVLPPLWKDWYVRRGDFYFLDEYSENSVVIDEMKPLYYQFKGVAYLRLEKVPPEIRENYRYMSRELNDKEYNDLPQTWRNMYSLGNDTKWHLRLEFRDAWGRNT